MTAQFGAHLGMCNITGQTQGLRCYFQKICASGCIPLAHLVGLVRLHNEGVARRAALFQAVIHNHKSVCGGLRPDVDAWILSTQQVLDEGGLACMQPGMLRQNQSAVWHAYGSKLDAHVNSAMSRADLGAEHLTGCGGQELQGHYACAEKSGSMVGSCQKGFKPFVVSKKQQKLGLTCRVLAQEQDGGLGREVALVQVRGEEGPKLVRFLQRPYLRIRMPVAGTIAGSNVRQSQVE